MDDAKLGWPPLLATAEAAAAIANFGKHEVLFQGKMDRFPFPIDNNVAKRVMMCVLAADKYLQAVRNLGMWDRGIKFDIINGHPIGHKSDRDELALQLADSRNDGEELGGLTCGFPVVDFTKEWLSKDTVTLWGAAIDVGSVFLPFSNNEHVPTTVVYGMTPIKLTSQIQRIIDTSPHYSVSPEAAACYVLCWASYELAKSHRQALPDALTLGGLILPERHVQRELEHILNDAPEHVSSMLGACRTNLLEVLATIRPSLRPLPENGPIAVRSNELIFLDLASCSRRLISELSIARQNTLLNNDCGDAFEECCRSRITKILGKERKYCALEGKKLRLNGKELTDLDAIVVKENAVYCINCYSKLLGLEIMPGGNISISSTVKSIYDKLREWTSKVRKLNELKKGDNFHFESYESLVPIVCLPHAPFMPLGKLTEELAPGLLRVCSLVELEGWLLGDQAPWFQPTATSVRRVVGRWTPVSDACSINVAAVHADVVI
ncbi:MAG: hypothetical protein U0640_08930 [Phycisphaerales bacterium]